MTTRFFSKTPASSRQQAIRLLSSVPACLPSDSLRTIRAFLPYETSIQKAPFAKPALRFTFDEAPQPCEVSTMFLFSRRDSDETVQVKHPIGKNLSYRPGLGVTWKTLQDGDILDIPQKPHGILRWDDGKAEVVISQGAVRDAAGEIGALSDGTCNVLIDEAVSQKALEKILVPGACLSNEGGHIYATARIPRATATKHSLTIDNPSTADPLSAGDNVFSAPSTSRPHGKGVKR
jgi:hypothetical protein